MKRDTLSEDQIQAAVVTHFRSYGVRPAIMFAVPNGGFRRRTEAARLNGQGVLAGIPDLCIVHNGIPYFLEIKTMVGRPTALQTEKIELLHRCGAKVAICYGLDHCLRQINEWGLMHGKVQ